MKNVLFPRFSDSRLWIKTAIGVLLMFVPILNIFAFGYLYRSMQIPRYSTDGGVQMPDWSDWGELAVDGLRFVSFAAVYIATCLVLSLVSEWLVVIGSFGFIAISWRLLMPLILVLFFPGFFVCLMVYQRSEKIRDLLAPSMLCHYLRHMWWPMIWPALAFIGLQFVCGILYGIAWFVGFGVAIASYNELLRHYGDRIDDSLGKTYR
jgi:hypothetical protein